MEEIMDSKYMGSCNDPLCDRFRHTYTKKGLAGKYDYPHCDGNYDVSEDPAETIAVLQKQRDTVNDRIDEIIRQYYVKMGE